MIRAPKQWYKTRVALTQHLKNQVSSRVGRLPKEITVYQKRLERELRINWKPSRFPDFLEDVAESRIVLGSDFHSHLQSQRTHLRILRELPMTKKIVLAMECISSDMQEHIDAYMADRITEADFLNRTEWNRNWSFPWINYRPLFEWAKARKVPVFGINMHIENSARSQIKRRDQFASEKIVDIVRKYPEHLVYVVYGEIHLTQVLLPQTIEKLEPKLKGQILRIHQDIEGLYFQLLKRGQENEFDVFRAHKNMYCILTSPPWVKWQSYLLHLDRQLDDEDEDQTHSSIELDQCVELAFNYIQWLCRDLDVKVKADRLEVFGPMDVRFFDRIRKSLNAAEQKTAHFLIENERSFYLPKQGWGYVSRSSSNHASTIAGLFVHAAMSGRKQACFTMPRDFLRFLWIEAIAFFLSLLMNPKRKPENLSYLMATDGEVSRFPKEAVGFAVRYRIYELRKVRGESVRRPQWNLKRKTNYLIAARILGQTLGQDLYLAYRKGRVQKRDMNRILTCPTDKGDFEKQYYTFLSKISRQGVAH